MNKRVNRNIVLSLKSGCKMFLRYVSTVPIFKKLLCIDSCIKNTFIFNAFAVQRITEFYVKCNVPCFESIYNNFFFMLKIV